MLSLGILCNICHVWFSIYATVSVGRFVSLHCLSRVLHCLLATVFCTYIDTAVTYIKSLIIVSLISSLNTTSLLQVPAYLARFCHHNSLLWSTFTVYSFGLCVSDYLLFIAHLFKGAGHILFCPSMICFAIVCVQSHWFFIAI